MSRPQKGARGAGIPSRDFLDFTMELQLGTAPDVIAKRFRLLEADVARAADAWALYGRRDVREAFETLQQPAVIRAKALISSTTVKSAESVLNSIEAALSRKAARA